jgi:hypothetical protein
MLKAARPDRPALTVPDSFASDHRIGPSQPPAHPSGGCGSTIGIGSSLVVT